MSRVGSDETITMRIVENSYYEHNEHGLVKVVDVTNGVVSMEKRNEVARYGGMQFPAGAKQAASGFQDDAEPANITVDAKAALLDFNLTEM